MSRRVFVAALAGLAISTAPALRAQSSSATLPPVQAAVQSDDSLYYAAPVNQLAMVVITAEADSVGRYDGIRGRFRARNDIRALSRENRSLEIKLARYDQKIEQLENRLVYLKTVVTDSLKHETAKIDSATASTRARRLELEARLKELEARYAVPVLASTPSDSTTAKKANE
ncbi:MAG TPA: hypothetical protein VKA84_17885 [Gemmatimonadaceae bacterium]|nr:hypothetical protein [Gemmatimonadaceae bacterium]